MVNNLVPFDVNHEAIVNHPFPETLEACEEQAVVCWNISDALTTRLIKLLIYIRDSKLYRTSQVQEFTSFEAYLNHFTSDVIHGMARRKTIYDRIRIVDDAPKLGIDPEICLGRGMLKKSAFVFQFHDNGQVEPEDCRDILLRAPYMSLTEVQRELYEKAGICKSGWGISYVEFSTGCSVELIYFESDGHVYKNPFFPRVAVDQLGHALKIEPTRIK